MLTDEQITAFRKSLLVNEGEGRTPNRRGIIVREPNPRYYNGPANSYWDGPTPMFNDRNLTDDDIRAALERLNV